MEVKVKIKDPILRNYLRGLFKQRDGGFAVTMDNFTGAVICSLVRIADYPKMIHEDETTVLFHLPKSRYNDSLRNKYLYVTAEAEDKINAVLRKEFENCFMTFLTESRIQGFKLKDIITAFIVENNMDIFDGDIETLKKRFYRKEIYTLRNMHKKLRSMAYSTARRTRESMKRAVII